MTDSAIYRYMCLIVWAHGLPYLDEIVGALEDDPDWEILITKNVTGFDPSQFIMQIYGCDSYPLEHLQNKITYLKSLPAETAFLFLKSFNTGGEFVGTGPFRAWQAKKMVEFKNRFREKYNPRNADGSMCHDHIIHGTDNEGQTDYLLKLIGYTEGINIFEKNTPFPVPYHMFWNGRYRVEFIDVSSCRVNVLFREAGGVVSKPIPVCDTPHFQGIKDSDIYRKYLREFQYTHLFDHYSLKKFSRLQQTDIITVLREKPILVARESDYYSIWDGAHRVAVAMAKDVRKFPAAVVYDY